MAVALFDVPVTHWECPNCDFKSATKVAGPHSHLHPCKGLAGLTVPMTPEGTRVKITARERDDYIGSEDVQYDGNGRPVAQVITERPDGSNDVIVFAPTAHSRSSL